MRKSRFSDEQVVAILREADREPMAPGPSSLWAPKWHSSPAGCERRPNMDNVAEPRQARREAAKSIDAERDIGRYSASFGVSLGLTSLFNALLVIVKESNQDTVLAWMAAATGHHWVTQGVLVLLVFAVLGLALTRFGEAWRFRPDLVIASVVGGVVVGSLVIAGFFL